MQTYDRIALFAEIDEVATIDPFLLHELDRVIGARADEDEEDAAIAVGIVLRPHILGINRPEGRGTANDAVATYGPGLPFYRS